MTEFTIGEHKAYKAQKRLERRAEVREANRDLIYQFVIGLAEMDLSPPAGENAAAFSARRLKQIRSTAREYVHQIGQMQD